MRVRLKADGRVVEIRNGREMPLAPQLPAVPTQAADELNVRSLRARLGLTQTDFSARLGLPIDTIRNWEQGKRQPRGPARALLLMIARAPELAFDVLGSLKR